MDSRLKRPDRPGAGVQAPGGEILAEAEGAACQHAAGRESNGAGGGQMRWDVESTSEV